MLVDSHSEYLTGSLAQQKRFRRIGELDAVYVHGQLMIEVRDQHAIAAEKKLDIDIETPAETPRAYGIQQA